MIGTKTPSPESMQDWAEKLAKIANAYEYCPTCHYPLQACRCAALAKQKELAQEQKKRAEIERLGGVRAFEDFTADRYTNKSVLRALENFPKENFYLWGPAGSGKTHACVAVLRNIAGARVVRMSQVSREIRAVKKPDEEELILTRYSTVPMLLDDLGSEKATEFLQNMLFEIMDRRWQAKRGGLLITANMSIDKLGAIIGDRTASRIAGLVGGKNVLELSGTDYRLQGALL